VISEVKASHRLFQDIERHGGKPILWKTGHSLIKAKMKETGALLAGEMSGHMFFKDRYFGFDDAIYAAARLFEILSESRKTPLQLLADLPPSFCTPEIRMECADDKKFEVVSRAKRQLEDKGYRVNPIDGARVEFEDGWGLVRASNTQAVLVLRFEATSERRLNEIKSEIELTVNQIISAL
jgi:phosphomannomutase/phosphoglucomutase